jgi:Holliday junction resolvase RusA-like endonuclease
MRIEFTVPGQPVPKGRPRFSRGKSFVRTYTPEETKNYEAYVRYFAAQAMRGVKVIEEAVKLTVEINLKIPKSESQKRKALMLEGRILPTKKPDGDNVLKALKDAINGLVWRDDAQVVDGRYLKRYSESPCLRVTVETIMQLTNMTEA